MIKILVFLLLSPAKRLSLVNTGDFLGDAVVKTPCFHCKGAWVQSLVRKLRSHMLCVAAKKKTKQTDTPVSNIRERTLVSIFLY